MQTDDIHVPVLIVGGSLVGLSMSLFLSWQGVPSLLVERHPEPARLPRARGYNARTMELFRALGLEETIRSAQSPNAANRGMLRVESLVGRVLAHLDEGGTPNSSLFSPSADCIIGQERLEPILIDAAKKMGSDLLFNTTMLSFEQDETSVSALIYDRPSGREYRVHAQYLIAADGNHSSIRDSLSIQAGGPGTISYMTDVAFEADLHNALRGRHIYIYYVSNPRLPDGQAGLMPLDNELRWSFGFPFHPERGERREDLTDEHCTELIRIATGVPDLAVKILPAYPWDPVKVGVWELMARYAEHYQRSRIFLAGDSAHTVLPSGGLGAGTGIQDAFNLAWKLALVLHGKAGSALLASYEDERLPIGNLSVEQTLQRHFYRTGTAESTLIDYSELIFGYRYRSSAIISEPGSTSTPLTQHPATLHGEPGTRAPHILLERAGSPISIIDLYMGHWTLLTGSLATIWQDAAHQISQHLDLPLCVYSIGGTHGLQDIEDRWDEAYGVGANGAVLVRPDGFIAWRTRELDDQPALTLEKTLTRVLARSL